MLVLSATPPIDVRFESVGGKIVQRVFENKNSIARSLDPLIMVAIASNIGASFAVEAAGGGKSSSLSTFGKLGLNRSGKANDPNRVANASRTPDSASNL